MTDEPKDYLTSHELADLLLSYSDGPVLVETSDAHDYYDVRPFSLRHDPADNRIVIMAKRDYV